MSEGETKVSDGYKFIEWIHRNCKRIQMSFDEQEKGIIVLNGMFESAEKRGFERAKRACIEKAKTYRHYAVKGVPTSNKIIYELENLKYEEA